MKILITGLNSYVGTSFKKWLSKWPDKYQVESISVKGDEWRQTDFSQYDVLFHVAAIVHNKECPEMEDLFYKVNRDLTIDLANKAKKSGIKQFIFMSSISVYGSVGEINNDVILKKDTSCNPVTFYGKSKLAAENELRKLNDEDFKVAIIRAPMVYGPDCPGNYERLRKFMLKVPAFPLVNNQRSMVFIDNLSEFIRLLMDNQEYGLFFPQNQEYVNVSELVQLIAKENSKKVYLSRFMSLGVRLFGKRVSVLKKVFGNLTIDASLSSYNDFKYCVVDFKRSVKLCEGSYLKR